MRITDDKQVKHQSIMAKPDAKISAKNFQKDKKSSEPEATQILTGYEAVGEDIVKTLGNTIRSSVKHQHKYQTLQVKIALSSFSLPQFNKYWMTDLEEELMIVTLWVLWVDCKPCEFLMQCSASSFKVIQTSKGRRKLVGYFKNWETTLKALNAAPVTLPSGKVSICNKPKKKDKVPSLKPNKQNNNQLKASHVQKKAKNTLKSKDHDKDN
ncbi:hypothetical protein RhiirA1_476558 [Rhizophagus irregularis]|uniref:Uncharacterized protein n=1 Tax=Rhizophagus irregularis TaxID=588596 RepID=A0A2N0QV18_9GLOM|nr:hypothetical protein RhiirA1_476558 [Rhizophagus irregularis]